MNTDIDQILGVAAQRKSIKEPQAVITTIRFKVGSLQTPVEIRFYRTNDSGKVRWEQSHFICTPANPSGPYKTTESWGEDAEQAAQRAFRTLTENYEAAVRRKAQPSEDWLVLNPDY